MQARTQRNISWPFLPWSSAAAAAAKSRQSCPTLCDPHRRQPTRLCRPWWIKLLGFRKVQAGLLTADSGYGFWGGIIPDEGFWEAQASQPLEVPPVALQAPQGLGNEFQVGVHLGVKPISHY